MNADTPEQQKIASLINAQIQKIFGGSIPQNVVLKLAKEIESIFKGID